MKYSNIKLNDIANGTGIRVSLFVSGCTHHCIGCFNKETWSFNYGTEFTVDTEDFIISELSKDWVSGLSILGGEPFEPVNQKGLLPFIRKVRHIFPDKSIWCYTGYLFDVDLVEGGSVFCEETNELLSCYDVIVDGPFVIDLKDITLKFKGSSNQRVIDVALSRSSNRIIEKI